MNFENPSTERAKGKMLGDLTLATIVGAIAALSIHYLLLLPLFAAALVLSVRILRIGVFLSSTSVTIKNVFGSSAFVHAEIERITGEWRPIRYGRIAAAVLVLKDGRRIWMGPTLMRNRKSGLRDQRIWEAFGAETDIEVDLDYNTLIPLSRYERHSRNRQT
jgi:hypothetical protein